MAGNIQFKRGNKANLPNPLKNGEPGWATDTKQLYVGNGTINENLFVAGSPETTAFNIYCATATYGGDTIASGRTGRRLDSTLGTGTTTATTASKLVNGNKTFDSTVVGMTVFNTVNGTFAKVNAVDSATILSLSHDIMTSGQTYEIAKSISTLAEAWSVIPAPYSANVTLQISTGTFAGATLIGKTPTGNVSVTINGSGQSGVNKTTINTTLDIFQKVTIKNIETTSDVRARYGADVTWYTCTTTSPSKLYTYTGSNTRFETGTFTVGNNPENVVNVAGTVTKGYSIYVATVAQGATAGADGLAIENSTTTSTTANKLVNSAGAFTSALLNKTVYNSIDDTWAKITAVDSVTTLSLSADIMVSGESYFIVDAISTVVAALNQVPGLYNCNITIKLSTGTYTEAVIVRGKFATDAYTLMIEGSKAVQSSGTATSNNTTTMTDTSKAWGVNAFVGKVVRLTNGTTTSYYVILSNTATVLTYVATMYALSGTVTYEIIDWGTTFTTTTDPFKSYCDVTYKYIKCTGNNTASSLGFNLQAGKLSLYGCYSSGYYYCCWFINGGAVYMEGCKMLTTAANLYAVRVAKGTIVNLNYSHFSCSAKGDGGSACFIEQSGAGVIVGCRLDYASVGLDVLAAGSVRMNLGSGFNAIDNCTTGANTTLNGVCINITAQTFTNNTANTAAATGGQNS